MQHMRRRLVIIPLDMATPTPYGFLNDATAGPGRYCCFCTLSLSSIGKTVTPSLQIGFIGFLCFSIAYAYLQIM
jgi:hypothetical protein